MKDKRKYKNELARLVNCGFYPCAYDFSVDKDEYVRWQPAKTYWKNLENRSIENDSY